MTTIQVVIEPELLNELNQEIEGAPKARSAFIRNAIRAELRRRKLERLEEQHRLSYLDVPETPEESAENALWESLQDPGEGWDASKR